MSANSRMLDMDVDLDMFGGIDMNALGLTYKQFHEGLAAEKQHQANQDQTTTSGEQAKSSSPSDSAHTQEKEVSNDVDTAGRSEGPSVLDSLRHMADEHQKDVDRAKARKEAAQEAKPEPQAPKDHVSIRDACSQIDFDESRAWMHTVSTEKNSPQHQPRGQEFLRIAEFCLEMKSRNPEKNYCQCQGAVLQNPDERKLCRCWALSEFVRIGLKTQSTSVGPPGKGSMKTYLGAVKAFIRESVSSLPWTQYELRHIKFLEEWLGEQYAEEKVDRALGLGVTQGNKILKKLVEAGYPRIAAVLWLISLAGCRNACLSRVEYRDFYLSPSEEEEETFVLDLDEGDEWMREMVQELAKTDNVEEFWANFRRGKNRKKVQHKFFCHEDVADNSLVLDAEVWAELKKEFRAKAGSHPNQKPFGDITTQSINEALKSLDFEETTYHFRKHFAARVYAHSGGNKSEVARRLGHRGNDHNAEAFYMGAEMAPLVKYYQKKFSQLEAFKHVAWAVQTEKAKREAEAQEEAAEAPPAKKQRLETASAKKAPKRTNKK
jgi:hypothetical protein